MAAQISRVSILGGLAALVVIFIALRHLKQQRDMARISVGTHLSFQAAGGVLLHRSGTVSLVAQRAAMRAQPARKPAPEDVQLDDADVVIIAMSARGV